MKKSLCLLSLPIVLGSFTIRIGYPERNIWKSNENLKASSGKDDTSLQVSF